MADRELLAFHATRLIDFADIREQGLHMLVLEQHVILVKRNIQDVGDVDAIAEIDAAVAKMLKADRFFINREGAVWATPMRKFLHDGGCDGFYESFGGEAIERIAGYAGGLIEKRLKHLGEPAVVIFRYPTHGWCEFTPGRLAQTMIELYLQHEGNWEATNCGWDIMITRDVPAANIIAVASLNDPAVRVR